MRKFIRIVVAGIIGIICSTSAKSQDFPAAEKEVADILTTGKWIVDSVGKAGAMKIGGEAMSDIFLLFKADGTYSISFFGKEKGGKWNADMTEKKVKIFEKGTDAKSIIISLGKERIVMIQEDGSDFRMVFKPAK